MLNKMRTNRLTAFIIIFLFTIVQPISAIIGATGNNFIAVFAAAEITDVNAPEDSNANAPEGAEVNAPEGAEANAPEGADANASEGADNNAGDIIDVGYATTAELTEAALPASPAPDYSDLSANYADLTQDEKAEILNRLGLLLGDPDRGLMLDIKVRRSDAAVFFVRLLGQEQYVKDRSETDFATSRFPDAPEGMWYTPYISFCTSIGIIAGRTDGYYYPDDNIS